MKKWAMKKMAGIFLVLQIGAISVHSDQCIYFDGISSHGQIDGMSVNNISTLKKDVVYEILGNIPVDWKEAFGNELCRTNQDENRRPMQFSFSTSKGVAEIKISGNSEIRERKLLVSSDTKMVLGLQKVKQILAINSLVAENDNLLLNIYNIQSKPVASLDFKSLSAKFFPSSKIIWKQNEGAGAFMIFDSTLVKEHKFLSMVDSIEGFYNSLFFRRMKEPDGHTRCAFIEHSRKKKDGYFEFRSSGKSNNPVYFLTNRIELDGKNCSDLDSLYGFYFAERMATFFQPVSKGESLFEVRGLNGYKYNSGEIKAGVDRLEAKYLPAEVKNERMFQNFLRGSIDTVILTEGRMDTIGYLSVQCATAKNVIEEARALSVLGWAINPETPLQEKVFLSSDSAKTTHERFSKLCIDLGKGVFVVESSNENSNAYDTDINLNGDESSIISEFLFHNGRVFAKPNSVGHVLPNNLLWIGQYELNGNYFPAYYDHSARNSFIYEVIPPKKQVVLALNWLKGKFQQAKKFSDDCVRKGREVIVCPQLALALVQEAIKQQKPMVPAVELKLRMNEADAIKVDGKENLVLRVTFKIKPKMEIMESGQGLLLETQSVTWLDEKTKEVVASAAIEK